MAGDDDNKQFDPTPKRRENARKEGQFARSRDLGGVAASGAVLAVLIGGRENEGALLTTLFHRTLGNATAIGRGDEAPWRVALATLAALCVPVLVGAAVGGSLAGFAQAGIHIQTSMLGFRPERLNPLPKLQNMVDPKHALIETVMSLLRVGAVGFVGYRVVMLEVPRIIRLAGMPLNDGVPIVIEIVVRVVMWVLGALAVVAAADWAQSKIVLERSLKMSRQEIMDEQKSEDGDPKVKARMRQRARAMARKRAMNAVKDASVVVTNPTHVSVALRYREGDPAPIVVAKGHDEVAMEIRARARQHGIPIIESRALARALDKEVRVGQPVPAAHYAAVAKVLAFVFRLKGRRPGPSPRQRVSGSSATSR